MRTTIITCALLLTLLAGCSGDATRAGERLAGEFLAAWGDTASLARVDRHYRSVEDSLWMPGSAMHLKKAFLEGTARDDSTRAVAQLMAYDVDHYASLQAYRIFQELEAGSITPDHARMLVGLIDWSADLLGKPDHAAAAKRQIDHEAGKLSVARQMALYSSVATPTMLGLSLKADRDAPDADTVLIGRQVRELEKIYDAEQLSEFRQAYGQ